MYQLAKQVRTAFVALLLSLGFAGCIAVGASDRYESKSPTIGKQLQDLKVARDSGAVTEQEYQQTKAKLLSDGH